MASILVLDDRAVERELLSVVLSSVGHTVSEASNGEDAIEQARAEKPDLIIADILMPGMDGYEFVRRLREDPSTAASRVILCTATYGESEVQSLAWACGVSQVLIKPIEPEKVLRAVKMALETDTSPLPLPSAERFEHEHLRTANAKLIQKLAELEQAGEARRLLAAIVLSSDDAIIAKTLDSVIVSWNRGAEVLYGYSAAEAVGQPIAMLVPPDRPDEVPAIMQRIKRGEFAHRLETRRVRKDGSTIDVALTISPIYDDNGELTGAATIARDISARKQAEQALGLAHRAAVQSSHAKTEFVMNMSHELRTPLNGVIGMTRLLGDTALDGQQREYVEALAESGEALLTLVSDVLDFSDLEEGRVELAPIDFDCRDAVEEALLTFAAPAHAKGLEIGHSIDDDIPTTVHGDRARLCQVLRSLLGNAVKFTASGEVMMNVSTRTESMLRFEVCDTGVGIGDSPPAALFDAFAQADQSATREYGGPGLGLAISRELVTRMGGAMGAENRAGGGSMFWFTAELPASAGTTAPREGTPGAVHANGHVRALLAEDNEVNIIVAEALLAKAGVRAEIAKNGREAVEMASGSPYEVIFMDCQMPELDGYEATQRIREAEHGHHTPIIAMTAHSMTGDRERCLAVGMDDYLTKPLRTDELERVLSRWLPADGSQKDLELSTNATGGVNAADSEDAEHDGEDPADELDEDAISELRDTLAAEMLETLLSTFEDSVSERLTEMTGALAGGDRSELRRLAHLLKGSSATLGASRMSAVCSELEQRCGDPEAEVSHAQLDELGASFQSACPALRSRLLS